MIFTIYKILCMINLILCLFIIAETSLIAIRYNLHDQFEKRVLWVYAISLAVGCGQVFTLLFENDTKWQMKIGSFLILIFLHLYINDVKGISVKKPTVPPLN